MFGIGDKVLILNSSNKKEVNRMTEIASICGKSNDKNYHLKIDGEEKIFKEKDLKLIEKANKHDSKNIRLDRR